ncbi:neutral/alkaline non-lysosomal ceramidase N-terminal domain-containing protein [Telluribacter sp. SYSU D00476]|uniref:neutral/alkaline non-lysosomal ceramidase N-terminal domain-containing protein n=1 Tax=Telluribacter sp. SYSU D00476 TaxID=2811430 RepID=UPI001FF60B36|nr:neutral/alkaline non-lysosomal ceramidase N-terminal domain-containing protein [Telluribacter sp. SYSU D00476]
MKKIVLFLASLCLLATLGTEAGALAAKGWKAGVARRVITPKQPMWMAGFAVRNHPSEGTLHDLWAKALVLEDEEGKQAVLVTTDLLGIPKGISDRIRTRLYTDHKLSKAQIILNSSHTHSGPVLSDALFDIYPLDAEQITRVNQYSRFLEDQIVALVGEALRKTEPARIYAENGVTRFQVNRRNNNAAVLPRLTELQGPNDYAVPVLKVENERGELKAVAFGYACHPTVLNGYQWSGDYVGFAQIELEKAHPGATALFFQGTGADQNPLPRNTIPLAQQYGRELAAAVDRVLQEEMHALPARLSTAYSEIELPLTAHPDKEGYAKIAKEVTTDYQKRWANRMASKLQQGEAMPKTYPYPVQVWHLGDLPLVTLGGEVVVEYAIKLKQIFGPSTFVMGYSNDVMAYIPSSTILREGGYEGESSQMVYGLPSTWESTIETMILYEAVRLARQAGVPTP